MLSPRSSPECRTTVQNEDDQRTWSAKRSEDKVFSVAASDSAVYRRSSYTCDIRWGDSSTGPARRLRDHVERGSLTALLADTSSFVGPNRSQGKESGFHRAINLHISARSLRGRLKRSAPPLDPSPQAGRDFKSSPFSLPSLAGEGPGMGVKIPLKRPLRSSYTTFWCGWRGSTSLRP